MIEHKKGLALWLAAILLLLAGALLTGSPGRTESVQAAMRDSVLHDVNQISLFGWKAVNPGLISAFVVTGVLLLLALCVRLFAIPRFRYNPGKLQMVLEEAVGVVRRDDPLGRRIPRTEGEPNARRNPPHLTPMRQTVINRSRLRIRLRTAEFHCNGCHLSVCFNRLFGRTNKTKRRRNAIKRSGYLQRLYIKRCSGGVTTHGARLQRDPFSGRSLRSARTYEDLNSPRPSGAAGCRAEARTS